MEKLLGENDYIKNLIGSIERRIDEEMDRRLRQDFDIKAFLEQKLTLFKDEIVNNQFYFKFINKTINIEK